MTAAVSAYIRHVLTGRDDLSSSARHLLETLGHISNPDGISYWSVPALAARMGYRNRMTVQRARAELVTAGLITFVENRGRRATNFYALPITAHRCALCDVENRASTRENRASTRGKPRTGARRSIHEGSIEDAPARANGFDRRASLDYADQIIALIRARRYDEIPG